MFIRKYWIPLLVFSIAIMGVGLYLLTIQQLPEPIVIIKPVEPSEESTAEKSTVETEAPSDTSQSGHFHADGTQRKSLTYHAKLLASHPVEALRQQSKERGHWSTDHMPPFPPDDQEAAEYARAIYLMIYYRSTGHTDHPKYTQARKVRDKVFYPLANKRIYDTMWELARCNDLSKIGWAISEPFDFTPLATTFTVADGINPQSARELFPFELDMSIRPK